MKRAFTLSELLVAMAVLSLLMVLLLSITNQTTDTWRYATGRMEQFREAREAFESITRRLSQATLNTYWDYDDPLKPTRYLRQSELRFISGQATEILPAATAPAQRRNHAMFFQAPLGLSTEPKTGSQDARGLENLLNTWGYFLEFSGDFDSCPDFLKDNQPERFRFRLKELMEPSGNLSIYRYTSGLAGSPPVPKNLNYTGRQWFTDILGSSSAPVHVLAENVISFVVLPKLPVKDLERVGINQPEKQSSILAEKYLYDSSGIGKAADYAGDSAIAKLVNTKNQLPPLVQVTIVAIDEASAIRLADNGNMPAFTPDDATLFTEAIEYKDDLETLEAALVRNRIAFRTFSTAVSVKAAKWSSEESP